MAPNINHTPLESNTARIPDGYLVIIGHNDQRYIVPEFMVPALHQMFEGYRKKDSLEVFTATGSVSGLSFSPGQQTCLFNVIGEGKVMAPTIPGTSDRERLSAHAEVLALQERLGLSYKDAAHRLYMAELERMKSDERMYKAFANLQAFTEYTLGSAYDQVRNIETSLTTDPGNSGSGAQRDSQASI
ncbi:hypothetical protein BYT27DRAFT_7089498 [Phlegmacium glaucopus]|nr:hypothetical protein BYT27DRAFT_7089498 [Phlegmacium glaucopus]